MNQNPEQRSRDQIDQLFLTSGWVIQDKKRANLAAANGVAIREYQTDLGPANYMLFVDKKPVGIIGAKRQEEGIHLTIEDQSQQYSNSKLKYINNDPLPFAYESTDEVSELLIEGSTNQAIASIHFKKHDIREKPFLNYFPLKNYNDIRRMSSGGVQPNLNLGIVKKTPIPPPFIKNKTKSFRK